MLIDYEAMGTEIHIKFGGDHGDESFKISYQVIYKNIFSLDCMKMKKKLHGCFEMKLRDGVKMKKVA